MDCHEETMQWQLLGVFKIDNISEGNGWMGQLFKHQGVCVWGDDTYELANNMRDKILNSCTVTQITLEDGRYLYYGTKPEQNGNITLGLYTDNRCSKEYIGNVKFDVFELAGTAKSYWVSFNKALEIYKQCQPFIAYDLLQSGFHCEDEAGYTNCNQCMKFENKAGCQVASMDDVMLASKEGGLVSSFVNGVKIGSGGYSSKQQATLILAMSKNQNGGPDTKHHFPIYTRLFFALGLAMFLKAYANRSRQKKEYNKRTSDEELISDKNSFNPSKKWSLAGRPKKKNLDAAMKLLLVLVIFVVVSVVATTTSVTKNNLHQH